MIRYIIATLRKSTSTLTFINNNLNYQFSSKKYILSQFPYPSGELHMGHARVYYIGDTLARFYKLQKDEVIYPIGFDSFGLPAENAAILHGKNPKIWTQTNIKQMKEQLNCLNINFDWNCQIATHTPQYYKWTQLIFLQMFKKGLAYKGQSQVNWDPIDKTVLANEQVDNLGRSWRSGAIVEKKMLSQWFLRITKYAEELQNNLPNLEWIERVKSMQYGWIGFERGYNLQMEIIDINEQNFVTLSQKQKLRVSKISVFVRKTSDIENNNCFIRFNRQSDKQGKNVHKQIILGYAKNPMNGNKIRIIQGYEQNGIIFQLVLKKNHESENSTQLNINSKHQIKFVPSQVMRIRDWSISRQRYWGTPIPIIYCRTCGIIPVPENQLPVILPQWRNQGNPLLSEQFKRCKCPKCLQPAQRQTDTMDTFVDSSWYYLRFLDNLNTKQLCSKENADKWMPVDIYVGGIEHAIMHLLYARFIMRTLSDMGVSVTKEPFKQLVVQGLVKGKTIKHKVTGKYLKPSQASNYKPEQLQEVFEKMSKSKANGLNPQALVEKYGPDALRIALFFAAPPEHDIDFHQDLLVSAEKFLRKVQETFHHLQLSRNLLLIEEKELQHLIKQFSIKHNTHAFKIKKILAKLQQSIQKRFMHVYVGNIMELFNEIKEICHDLVKEKNSVELVFSQIFIPALLVIAPKTVQQLYSIKGDVEINKLIWPKSSYFSNQKEYLIMKGNKLVKKGIIQYQNDEVSETDIKAKLNLDSDVVIKNNKKNIVIIVK